MSNRPRWELDLPAVSGTKIEQKYRRLHLKRNPFPAVGVASENPMYPPLGEAARKLEAVLRDFVQGNNNQIVGIVGTYGVGKTHTLRVIQETMQDPLFPRRPKIVYVASAGYELYSLLRNILDSFGRDEITKTIWRMLLGKIQEGTKKEGPKWMATMFAEPKDSAPFERPMLVDTANLPSGFTEEHFSDYRKFLPEFAKRKFSAKRLRSYAITILTDELRCSSFLAAELFDATDNDYLKAQAAWDRLTVPGEKGAPYKPAQEASVMTVLLTLTKLTGNYDSFVLLVDEFEATVSATLQRKQQESYLRSLRLLYDVSIEPSRPPALVMLAMTDDALKTMQSIYPAISQRLITVNLPLVDESLAVIVISSYLASERAEANDLPLPDDLFPFTRDAVGALLDSLSIKSLRELLVRCHNLIEHLASDKTIKLPVTTDTIEQFSREFEI